MLVVFSLTKFIMTSNDLSEVFCG